MFSASRLRASSLGEDFFATPQSSADMVYVSPAFESQYDAPYTNAKAPVMNQCANLLIIIVTALLGACATETVGHHSYHDGKCVDCWNNPITGEPINYQKGEESLNVAQAPESGESAAAPRSVRPVLCGRAVKFDLAGSVDIDTAYTRLKREFGYHSLDEMLRAMGVNPGTSRARSNVLLDSGYKHEAQPGVRYAMAEAVKPSFASEQEHFLTLELDKDGAGTRVYVKYCDGGVEGFKGGDAFERQLREEVRQRLVK